MNRERVERRVLDGLGSDRDSVEHRFLKFAQSYPSQEQRAGLRGLLLAMTVLETEIRAYYEPSSPVFSSFQTAAQALRVQTYFLLGDLSAAMRETLSDVLDGGWRADFGVAGFYDTRQRFEKMRIDLIEQLLSHEIRLG